MKASKTSLEQWLATCPPTGHPEGWDPPFCGDLDLVIRKDGTWWYQGTPMERPSLVRLFARVLRCEQGDYYLVTPVEKVRIQVEDAPFVATRTWRSTDDGRIWVETNIGDEACLQRASDVRIEMDAASHTPRPYVHVRDGLWALLSRPVYYQWVEWSEPKLEQDGWHAVLKSGPLSVDLGWSGEP